MADTAKEAMLALIKQGVTDREELIAKTMTETGVHRRCAQKIHRKIVPPVRPEGAGHPTVKTCSAMDLIAKERLDYDLLIHKAVAAFGEDDCIGDEDFRRQLAIPPDRWREIRDRDEYVGGYQVMLRRSRRRYWCHPAARKMLLTKEGVQEVN